MTSFAAPLVREGAIVSVEYGLARPTALKVRKTGRAIMSPVATMALVDSGAEVSVIANGCLDRFVREGMPLVEFVHLNAPGLSGLQLRPQYMVGLRIKHPSGNSKIDFVVPAVDLVEQDLGMVDYQVLIGRDILSRCIFTFDGPANTFSLTY
jgi:hypothetical protein